jgi:23S rRNA pseudouridine955/2504/2580 synthase
VRAGRTGPDILHEDQWIIVINKPPGLAMHKTAEEGEDLVQLGTRFLAGRDGFPGKLRPVNRLDRGTSGVVVLAKSPTAAGMFGRLVMGSGLSKVYLAIVQGRIPREGKINLSLEGKEAETGFRSLFQSETMALAAVYPTSGRMHQIRKHFQSIGHPVCGDRRYGGQKLAERDGIFLHSFRTSFIHPSTGEKMSLLAPLPEDFLTMIRGLAGEYYSPLLRDLSTIPAETH